LGSNFAVTDDGNLYANNVDLTGTINATQGAIGDFFLSNGVLTAKTSQDTSLINAIYARGLTLGEGAAAPFVNTYGQSEVIGGQVTFYGAILNNGQAFFSSLNTLDSVVSPSVSTAELSATTISTVDLALENLTATKTGTISTVVTDRIVASKNANCYLDMWYDPGSSASEIRNFTATLSITDGMTIKLTLDKVLYETKTFKVYFKSIFGAEETSFTMTIEAGGTSATKKTGVIFRVNHVYFDSGYSKKTMTFSQTKITKVSNRGGIDCHASLNPYLPDTYNLGNSSYYWQYVYVNNLMNKTASTEWSDKRFKREMRRVEDKYDKFYDDLSPTEYRFQDGKRLHFGLIANDLKDSLNRYNIDTNDFAPFVEFHLHD
jgi:hypothetical protein